MSELSPRNEHWVRTTAQFPEKWSLDGGALVAAYMGSMAHGTHLPSTEPTSVDDIDIMTIVTPPRQFVYGLRTFEHWVLQKDELDVVAYSLRKWVGLLLKSNPNVVGLLWLPERCYIAQRFMFQEWIANRERFLSKLIYKSFCGYAKSQLHGLGAGTTGRGYMGKDRKLLVHKYGYDLKHGAHCVRLLRMGTEALESGRLNVDRTDIDADDMKAIKRGEWSYERLQRETAAWEARMEGAFARTRLPEEPDYELAERLLLRTYEEAWKVSADTLYKPVVSVSNPR
jgi:uncharacterized protein